MNEATSKSYRDTAEREWARYRKRRIGRSEREAFRWAFSAGFDLGRLSPTAGGDTASIRFDHGTWATIAGCLIDYARSVVTDAEFADRLGDVADDIMRQCEPSSPPPATTDRTPPADRWPPREF